LSVNHAINVKARKQGDKSKIIDEKYSVYAHSSHFRVLEF